MRSMVAPMICMSRAARSSMPLTAFASHVGLSHSTQVRRPCNILSRSNGSSAGFIKSFLLDENFCHGSADATCIGVLREFLRGLAAAQLPLQIDDVHCDAFCGMSMFAVGNTIDAHPRLMQVFEV